MNENNIEKEDLKSKILFLINEVIHLLEEYKSHSKSQEVIGKKLIELNKIDRDNLEVKNKKLFLKEGLGMLRDKKNDVWKRMLEKLSRSKEALESLINVE